MNKVIGLLFALIFSLSAYAQSTAGLPPPSTITTSVTCATGCTLTSSGSGSINAKSIDGVTVTGTPSTGQVITATSSSAADWATPSATSGVTQLNGLTGVLNVVLGTQHTPLTGSSGNVIIPTDFIQVDAVNDLGLDNTGTNDVEAKLAAYSPPSNGVVIVFPCGIYRFNSTWVIPATSSTYRGIYLRGTVPAAQSGTSCVQFNGLMAAGGDIIEYDNTSAGSQQFYGLRVDNIQFNDGSGTGSLRSGLHIVETNNTGGHDVSFTNFSGKEYSTGTGTATNGSTAVTGSGTTWTTAMAGPNALWCQAGFCQEILSVNSSTSVTLVSQWQFPTQTNQAYAISYDGVGLLFDGGTAVSGSNFSQYGEWYNVGGQNNRLTVATVGSQSSSYGVSRISIFGGWTNCEHIDHSAYSFWGDFTDTMTLFGVKENSCTWFSLSESSQKNAWIAVRGENAGGTWPANSTCSGSPSQACTRGVEINSDRTNGAQNNEIIGSYLYNMGNAIQVDSDNVLRTIIIGNQMPNGVNTNNYFFVTSGNGKTSVQADDWDFFQSPAASGTLNGSAICTTATGCGGGSVSSVSNTDSTLTISPTTGSVVASLNLGHANTWTAAITAPSFVANGSGAGKISSTPTTVSGLPSASSVLAGTMIVVSDATSFTVGSCGSGGGSDYMIAISNGTNWTCH